MNTAHEADYWAGQKGMAVHLCENQNERVRPSPSPKHSIYSALDFNHPAHFHISTAAVVISRKYSVDIRSLS